MGNKTLLLTNKDTCEQKEITVEEFQKQYPNFTDKVLNCILKKALSLIIGLLIFCQKLIIWILILILIFRLIELRRNADELELNSINRFPIGNGEESFNYLKVSMP